MFTKAARFAKNTVKKSKKRFLIQLVSMWMYLLKCNLFLWWQSWNYNSHYSRLQCHMNFQKSFLHFLLLVWKAVVLLNIVVETRFLYTTVNTPSNPPLPTPALQMSEDDVHQVFQKQKRWKAPGQDGVTPACLKTCADQLAHIFSQIFNRSLELCEVPVRSPCLLQMLYHNPHPKETQNDRT